MELHISMIPSPEDPPWMSDDYQSGLRNLGQTLRDDGLEIRDVGSHTARAISGKWRVELCAALAPALGAPVDLWLRARPGRTVHLTIGEIEADVRTIDELISVIKIARSYQDVAENDA